jgi:hypothetical protein
MDYGSSIPDVFIGKISISNTTNVFPSSTSNLPEAGDRSHQETKVRIQFIIKRYGKFHKFYQKYYKVAIVPIISRADHTALQLDPTGMLKRIDRRLASLATEHSQEEGKSLQGGSVHIVDFQRSPGQSYPGSDNAGRKHTNYCFYKEFFFRNSNPGHLSILAVPILDTAAYKKDKSANAFSFGRSVSYRQFPFRDVYTHASFGKIATEVILQNGQVPNGLHTYSLTPGGRSYRGPIHQGNNNFYYTGESPWDGTKQRLFLSRKFNSKIIDYRIVHKIKRLQMNFGSTLDVIRPRSVDPLTHETGRTPRKRAYISDGGENPQYTRNSAGAMSFIMNIDIEGLLQKHSAYSRSMKNAASRKKMMADADIKSIRIWRRRVADVVDKNTMQMSGRVFNEDVWSESQDTLIAESTDRNFTRFDKKLETKKLKDRTNKSRMLGSIHQRDFDYTTSKGGKAGYSDYRSGGQAVRFIEVQDLDFKNLNSGKYRYRVELELIDNARELIRSSVVGLAQAVESFKEYIRKLEQPAPIPSFNEKSQRFTSKFIAFWEANYSRFSDPATSPAPLFRPPNEDIIYRYIQLIGLFVPERIVTPYAIKQLFIMVHPRTCTLESLYAILEMADGLVSHLYDKFKFEAIDNHVHSQPFFSNEHPNTIHVDVLLPHAVDASVPASVGAVYLKDYADMAMEQIPEVTVEQLQSLARAQRARYWNIPAADKKVSPEINFLTPVYLYTPDRNLVDLSSTREERDYIPKIIKYNIDKNLNSSSQSTNFRFSSSPGRNVDEDIYNLLINGVFPHSDSVVVEQFIKDVNSDNSSRTRRSLGNKNSEYIAGNMNANKLGVRDSTISSAEYLGRPLQSLADCLGLDELTQSFKDTNELLNSLKITQDYQIIVEYLISLLANKSHRKVTSSRDVLAAGHAGDANPMSTILAPRQKVKKLWNALDPGDRVMKVMVMEGFTLSSGGDLSINQQLWRDINMERLLTGRNARRVLCRLAPVDSKQQDEKATDYPIMGELFILKLPSNENKKKSLKPSLKNKIDTIKQIIKKAPIEVEYMTASPRQTQILKKNKPMKILKPQKLSSVRKPEPKPTVTSRKKQNAARRRVGVGRRTTAGNTPNTGGGGTGGGGY